MIYNDEGLVYIQTLRYAIHLSLVSKALCDIPHIYREKESIFTVTLYNRRNILLLMENSNWL